MDPFGRHRRADERAEAERAALAAALADHTPAGIRRGPAPSVRRGDVPKALRRTGAGRMAPLLAGLGFGFGGGVIYGLVTHLAL